MSHAREIPDDEEAGPVSFPEQLAEQLLSGIIEGRYPAGSALPPEGDLASAYGISRLTVREAVRILRSKNILEIKRGRGTFVTPPSRWTSLDALVRAEHHRDSSAGVSEKLLEARRMVEVGAAQLAALHRTDEDLADLAGCIREMIDAHEAGDLDRFVRADLDFHGVIMRASGNIFVPFMFEPFGDLLVHTRRQTSAMPVIQVNGIAEHRAILDCLRAGDPEAARSAMESHISQTRSDLRQYVLDGDPTALRRPDSPRERASG